MRSCKSCLNEDHRVNQTKLTYQEIRNFSWESHIFLAFFYGPLILPLNCHKFTLSFTERKFRLLCILQRVFCPQYSDAVTSLSIGMLISPQKWPRCKPKHKNQNISFSCACVGVVLCENGKQPNHKEIGCVSGCPVSGQSKHSRQLSLIQEHPLAVKQRWTEQTWTKSFPR